MGQDWKTLSLVIIGAAIIGWWTMRSLGGDANRRVASQPVALATVRAPAPVHPSKTAVEHPPAAEPAPPAKIPGTLATPDAVAANDGEDESAVIVRDLAALSQGLLSDVRVEDHVMPRVNDALDVPGIIQYRRAPDFWQSALGGGQAETKP